MPHSRGGWKPEIKVSTGKPPLWGAKAPFQASALASRSSWAVATHLHSSDGVLMCLPLSKGLLRILPMASSSIVNSHFSLAFSNFRVEKKPVTQKKCQQYFFVMALIYSSELEARDPDASIFLHVQVKLGRWASQTVL